VEKQVESGAYLSYRQVLDRAGRRLLEELGRPLAEEEPSPLPRSLPSWPAFPEVPGTLQALRERGYRLAILSNVDRDLLASSIARLGLEPDLAVTAEDARSYKPAAGHWRAFESRTGAGPQRTVHVAASLYHDIRAAGALGFRTVWIDRHSESPADAAPTRTLPDLTRLPEVVGELARLTWP
jgi:2-haloacid dehalogenase